MKLPKRFYEIGNTIVDLSVISGITKVETSPIQNSLGDETGYLNAHISYQTTIKGEYTIRLLWSFHRDDHDKNIKYCEGEREKFVKAWINELEST